MDTTDDTNSISENDDAVYSNNINTDQSVNDFNEIASLRKPRLPLDISIKQDEPEADHDFLHDKVLNTPFKSSNDHVTKAFKIFNDLRKQNILCDVVLKATSHTKRKSPMLTNVHKVEKVLNDEIDEPTIEINAHKVILSSVSSYFHAMFSGNMCEARANSVFIKDINGSALETLIDFIYTCEIHVNEENVQLLLPAANLLQLSEVKEACCEFLQYQLHPSNSLGIHQFADLHSCKDLLEISRQYCEHHFREIINHDEFVHLSLDQLESLVSSNCLSADEEEVFDSVKKWINFDLQQRQQFVRRLFAHIRFPLLSKEYLVQLTKTDELIRSDQACKDFLIDAMSYHLMTPDERRNHDLSIGIITPRNPVSVSQILIVIGGQAPKAVRTIEEYDFKKNVWIQNTELPTRRCRCGAVLNKDFIYVVGGFNGSLRVKSVERYDLTRNIWESVAQMNVKRSTLGVATMNGLIYAVGGFDGTQGLSSAEVYDPEKDSWKEITCMSTRRSSIGLSVLNGVLYVVGGYDGLDRECLSTVECYHPTTDTWESVESMSFPRSGPGVGTLDGMLYAVGGHDGPRVRKTVERYCPIKKQWSPVANMNIPRRNAGVVSYAGLLYVVGGDDGNMSLSSMEVYDPHIDSWTLMDSNMSMARSYSGVLLVPRYSRRI